MSATIGNNDAWIGVSDIEYEGHFLWLDGVTATSETIGWADGEPNNDHGREHCGQVSLAGYPHNTANDLPCNVAKHGLCEKTILTGSIFGCILKWLRL